MANPFAYEEYRKDKIRQKIEESRTQRVQVKVRGPDKMSFHEWLQVTQFVGRTAEVILSLFYVCIRENIF